MAEMTREQRIGNIIELARGLNPQEKERVAMRLRCEAVLDAKRQNSNSSESQERWDFIEKRSREVDGWPDWKKAEVGLLSEC